MAIFYMDYENGVDSGGIATDTPLGWWSVSYTNGNGTAPIADETVTGATSGSTAKLTVVVAPTSGSWAGGDAAGKMYFYGKSAAFQSETVNSTSASFSIAGDFDYNPWKTFLNGATAVRTAPGDTIRVKQSPIPVSLGVTGKWTSKTSASFPAALSVTGTADNGSGLIRVTVSSTTTLTTNDVVQIVGLTGTVEANGSWLCTVIDGTKIDLQGSTYTNAYTAGGTCQKINEKAVVLSGAKTLDVCNCDVIWTGTGDTTTSIVAHSAGAKEGGWCNRLTLDASPQASTLQAYYPISISAAEANNWNRISLWFRNSASIADSNTWDIVLCSNADGTGVLDTFKITGGQIMGGRWCPLVLTREGGGTLGNNGATAIASIGIRTGSTTPTASSNIMIDNIIACTTSGLNLTSLLSLNSTAQGGTEGWFAIQSINKTGKIVLLDDYVNTTSNDGQGYYGAGGTATTYMRETIKTAFQVNDYDIVFNPRESGTFAGGYISYEGGFDSATNLQTGESFFDGQHGAGYAYFPSNAAYLKLRYFDFCRYGRALQTNNCSQMEILSNFLNNNSSYGTSLGGQKIIATLGQINNNLYNAVLGCIDSDITIADCNSSGVYDIYIDSAYNLRLTTTGKCSNNKGNVVAYNYATDTYIYDLDTAYNGSTAVIVSSVSRENYLINALIDGTEFSLPALKNSRICSSKHDQTAGNNYIATDYGVIQSVDGATYGHTGSGLCWKLSPTNVIRNSVYPLNLPIAKIACVANKLVTVKAWMKLSSTTDILGALFCRKNQLTGITTDVQTNMATTNTDYQEVTITFTPTEAGVVEVEALAWWVANTADENILVDDLTITQAD